MSNIDRETKARRDSARTEMESQVEAVRINLNILADIIKQGGFDDVPEFETTNDLISDLGRVNNTLTSWVES